MKKALFFSLYVLSICLITKNIVAQNWNLFPENQPTYFVFESNNLLYDNYGVGPYYVDSTNTIDSVKQHYILSQYVEDRYTGECIEYLKDMARFYNYDEATLSSQIEEFPLSEINQKWYYKEGLIFKPFASVGEQWQFHHQYSNNNWDYLTFTCDNIGMTDFVGLTDSVKYFSVQAFKNELPIDLPINESVYILSKNYGFISFVSFSQLNNGQHFQADIIGIEIDSTLYGTDKTIDFSSFFPYQEGDRLTWRWEHSSNEGDYKIYRDSITSISVENYSYAFDRITEDHSNYDGSVTITQTSGSKTFDADELNTYLKTSYFKVGFDIPYSNEYHEVSLHKNADSPLYFSYGNAELVNNGYCDTNPYADPTTYKFDEERGYLGYSGISGYGIATLELLSYEQANQTDVEVVAEPDYAETTIDVSVFINVLENDAEGVTITDFIQGNNGGEVSLYTDSTFLYIPPLNFCGTDAFEYTVMDENGTLNTTEVSILVDCNPLPYPILAEIICQPSDSFAVLFVIPSNLELNQYRICGDSAWTAIATDSTSNTFVLTEQGLANEGDESSYCVEFSNNDTGAYYLLEQDNIVCCCDAPIEANFKVFLEGAYDETTGLMKTTLSESGLLPFENPYQNAPYFMDYTQFVDTTFSQNIADQIVDWVLVEIRTGTPSLTEKQTSVVTSTAALLLKTGEIVPPHNSPLYLGGSLDIGTAYYICIRHRNHLDILSASPLVFDGEALTYDFTTTTTQAFGANQQMILPNGKAAMFTGDYTQDGIIQLSDFDAWKANPAQLNIYSNTDGTLDGVIQQTDNDAWFPNKAKIGTPEIRF